MRLGMMANLFGRFRLSPALSAQHAWRACLADATGDGMPADGGVGVSEAPPTL